MSKASVADQPYPNGTNVAVRYLELIRFSHTLFALPFALLATAWAYVVPLPSSVNVASVDGSPNYLPFQWRSFVGIVLCMITARSFAMAMNRLLDRRWDGENPRTANRHLPAKTLTPSSVAWFSVVCAVGFVACCTLFLPNILPLVLSVPVLAFLAGYSLAKRFTDLVHFWLGLSLMLAPVCAWIALRGDYVLLNPADLLPALSLGLVVLLWVSGFDIIYACQDSEFDRQAGLFSIPAKLGIKGALRVAAACHIAMWCLAMLISFFLPVLSLGWLFRGMLVGIAGLLVVEHSVVSEKSMGRVQLAFFQLNSVISILFLVFGIVDAYWQ